MGAADTLAREKYPSVEGLTVDEAPMLGTHYTKEMRMPRVALNATAPDFTLPDLHGNSVSLSGFLGLKNVLLVFNRTFA